LLDMRSIQLLVVLFFFVVESYQRCSHPKGATGELFTDGCLQRICEEGEWRTSLAENLCCYDRRAYTINTTISSIWSKDGCVGAAIDCMEEKPGHAEMMHTIRDYCEEEQNKTVMYLNMSSNKAVDLSSFRPLHNCSALVVWIKLDRVFLWFPVVAVIGEQLTVCGGVYGGDSVLDIKADCYTLSGGRWMEGVTPRMLERRYLAGSSWTKKGLLVTGGAYEEDLFHSRTEYLTASGGWVYGPGLPYNIAWHCQVSAGPDVYILGGLIQGEPGSHTPMSGVYRLAEGDSDWTKVTDMEYNRTRHACAAHDNYIYVLGGDGDAGYIGERLDLFTMTWENLPTLPHEFYNGQAFFFQSSLYLIHMLHEAHMATMVKLNKDNEWEITFLGVEIDYNIFPAPRLTPDILGCEE